MASSWINGLVAPELKQRALRAAKVTDDHWVRGMFFDSTIEVVRRTQGETGVAELRKQFSGESYVALRKYPMRDFFVLQEAAAKILAPQCGSFEEGVARTAAAAVEFFFESIGGRTMRLLAGSDPHRLLSASPNAYPLTIHDNAERKYSRLSDRSASFTFHGDLLGPCHQYGVFESAVRSACDVKPTIAISQSTPLDFQFVVSW